MTAKRKQSVLPRVVEEEHLGPTASQWDGLLGPKNVGKIKGTTTVV